jgi:hypothetical protein
MPAAVDGRPDLAEGVNTVDEAAWLACTNPFAMLYFLSGQVSERKWRLFASACCRRIWPTLVDERSRRAIEVLERLADGLADQIEATEAAREAARADRMTRRAHSGTPNAIAAIAARDAIAGNWAGVLRWTSTTEAWSFGMPHGEAQASQRMACARANLAALLGEIVGNPFHSLAIDPTWQTNDVIALGEAASEHRLLPSGELDPARLAVLCDSLEDAGCPQDHELLLHLRGPGPHVRGCHALDAILGRD